jgi:hypothetical protein
VIEVKYDDYPAETGLTLTLEESADALIASQSPGSFSTEGDAVFKTTYTTEKAYTFERTDTPGDAIYYQCVPVNGKPVAISRVR